MKIDFTFPVIICSSMIILGFFAAVILWRRKENHLSNKFLSLLLLTFSLWLIHTFYGISGIFSQNPNFYFRPIYYSFAFGPLIYFYVRSLTNSSIRFQKSDYIHFIPVLLQAGLYLFLFFSTYEYKNWYWHNIHYPYTYRIEFDGTFLSLAIYLFFSIRLLLSYQKWVQNNFSESSKIILNWLKFILTLFLLLCILWFAEMILREFYTQYHDFTIMLMGFLTLVLAYAGISQKNLSDVIYNKTEAGIDKSKVEIDPEILEKIAAQMKENKAYLNPSLTLKEFSQICKIPSRTISEHINHGLNKSFHDFVNEYRVNEVISKLNSIDRSLFTLESIAYDCGFNSKATFNRIFKKFTGTSPSSYKKD